ncbi:hypothetical protein KC19_9G036000 [Ceratodon purpureus]|uniref:Uncharacterized protein n=1 Tax=Ceratodon purpureus TaxID=3225 RepID=A0A8T0GRY3_CERPU|nr:hypothetical protein KC19_9G036000 [Ceratodon purpureus]
MVVARKRGTSWRGLELYLCIFCTKGLWSGAAPRPQMWCMANAVTYRNFHHRIRD